jgi:hypothetical protein
MEYCTGMLDILVENVKKGELGLQTGKGFYT